jgi:hypothetical protein
MAKRKRRKPKPKKLPRGRPRIELTPEQISRAAYMHSRGLSLDGIAIMLGISFTTLDERIREAKLAIAEGKEEGANIFRAMAFEEANLEDKLRKKACLKALGGDNDMIKFLLRFRYGLKEKIEITGKNDQPLIPPQPISTEAITQNVLAKIRKEEAADQKA